MPRADALRAIDAGEIEMRSIPLALGDVLIRHPWGCIQALRTPLMLLMLWSRSAMRVAGTQTAVVRSRLCHARCWSR
jgi:hypothetical protein